MERKKLNYHIRKINKILEADYDHEIPDKIRSKKFQTAFATLLNEMFPDCDIVTSLGAWCEASGFIRRRSDGKCVYYRTEDYRWPSGSSWDKSILYRTVQNEYDYYGSTNNRYADLDNFEECVNNLFKTI